MQTLNASEKITIKKKNKQKCQCKKEYKQKRINV